MTIVSRSGTVLDFNTQVGISGAKVYSLGETGTDFTDIVLTGSGGSYTIDVDDTEDVIYVPFKDSYQGYSRQLDPSIDDVVLYLVNTSGNPTSNSGALYTNLVNAPLVTSTNVRAVSSTPCDVFVVTDGGLDVFNHDTKDNLIYVTFSGGFNCLAVDDTFCDNVQVLLGTSSSGVYSIQHSNVSGTLGDRTSFLSQVKAPASLSSPEVLNLSKSTVLGAYAVGTSSGIDFVSSSGTVFSHDTSLDITACFLTDDGDLYYSPSNSGIYVKYGPITSDWNSPDYELDISSSPALPSSYINDIEVNTYSGTNHVFLATSSGLAAYNENRSSISSSEFKLFTVSGGTLSGSTENITGVEITSTANISGGLVTLSTLSGSQESIINPSDSQQLEDYKPIQILNIASSGIEATFNITQYETNLGRAGVRFLGSRFIRKL